MTVSTILLENLGAFATVLVGVIGFWLHAHTSKKFMRRQHTFDVVLKSVMDDVFQKRLSSIRVYFHDYNGNDTERKDPKNWQDTAEDSNLRAVLNYLEAIACALKNGDLDEQLLLKTYKGIVITLYEVFEDYIHAHRKNKKSQKAFENLEWLYDHWKKS